MHPHRPRFSLNAWRDLVGVSIWTWCIGVAVMVRDRSDALLIGRLQGPAGVGVFAAGSELATVPTAEVAVAASRAIMPGLADLRRSSDAQREADAVVRILGVMLLFSLPAGIGISLAAGPSVVALLGYRWIEAVPVVAIVGFACAFVPFDTVGSGWLRARAELRTLLAIILAGVIIRVSLLCSLTVWMGLTGAAAAVGLSMMIEASLTFAVTARRLGIAFREIREAAYRPLLAAAAMAGVLALSGLGWMAPPPDSSSALRELTLVIPAGAFAYGAVLAVLWLATGRREGAEADASAVLLRAVGSLRRFRAPPRRPGELNADVRGPNGGAVQAERWPPP